MLCWLCTRCLLHFFTYMSIRTVVHSFRRLISPARSACEPVHFGNNALINQRSLIIAWRGLLMAIACGTHGETRSGTKNKPATNARTMSFSPQRTRVETTHNIIDHARLIDDRHSRHFTLTPLALRTAPPNQRKGKVSSPWRPGGVPPRHVWCSRHAVSSSQSVICTGPQQ